MSTRSEKSHTATVHHRVLVLALSVAVLLLAGGCAAGDDGSDADDRAVSIAGPSPTGDTGPGSAGTADADRVIEVAVADGKVSPPPGRVEVGQGERIRIEVTTDQPDTVHLHGYDLEASVAPGAPGTVEFTADQGGQFELETHDSGLILLQLLVR